MMKRSPSGRSSRQKSKSIPVTERKMYKLQGEENSMAKAQ